MTITLLMQILILPLWRIKQTILSLNPNLIQVIDKEIIFMAFSVIKCDILSKRWGRLIYHLFMQRRRLTSETWALLMFYLLQNDVIHVEDFRVLKARIHDKISGGSINLLARLYSNHLTTAAIVVTFSIMTLCTWLYRLLAVKKLS